MQHHDTATPIPLSESQHDNCEVIQVFEESYLVTQGTDSRVVIRHPSSGQWIVREPSGVAVGHADTAELGIELARQVLGK